MTKKPKQTLKAVVSREDVEKKLHSVNSAVQDLKNESVDTAKVIAVIAIAVIVGIAFYSGRRRSLRPKTFLSITKTK
jgi:hypothetical protein